MMLTVHSSQGQKARLRQIHRLRREQEARAREQGALLSVVDTVVVVAAGHASAVLEVEREPGPVYAQASVGLHAFFFYNETGGKKGRTSCVTWDHHSHFHSH